MEHIYDMLIIGGGPAGFCAGLYGARAGFDVVILEKMAPGGQLGLTDVIDNYPGFDEGISGFELADRMQKGAEKYGAKTEYCEVERVELDGKIKTVYTNGGVFKSKTVVISTGANPRELGLESEKKLYGRGVHYCAVCDGRFYKGKTVVVVGGGNSAVEDATYLSKLAKEVHLVHRRDTLRATKIYHDPLMKAENIVFHWNSKVEEILADDTVKGVKLRELNTDKISEVACDGVFVSVGRKPATDFLKDAVKLDAHGYVVADESTKTDIEGVFAIGDVRTKALRQVVTAVADGAVAVHYAEEYLNTLK